MIEHFKGRDVYRTGQKKKLYACSVDFKKAFDTVPRDLLWQALDRSSGGCCRWHVGVTSSQDPWICQS